MAAAGPGKLYCAASDGDRHRRLHGEPMRRRTGEEWADSRTGRGAGDRGVRAPRRRGAPAWSRRGGALDPAALERMSGVIGLEEALGAANDIISGAIRGRLVVDVNR